MDKKLLFVATISFILIGLLMHNILNFVEQRHLHQQEVEFKLMNLTVKKVTIDSLEPISVSLVSKKIFVTRIDRIDYLSQYNLKENNYFITTILPEEKTSEIEIVSNHALVKGIFSSNREILVTIQSSWIIFVLVVLLMAFLFMIYFDYIYKQLKDL